MLLSGKKNPKATGYIVQIKKASDDDSMWNDTVISGNSKVTFRLDFLELDTPYVLRVLAFKEDLKSIPSEQVDYLNKKETIDSPKEFIISTKNSARWQKVPKATGYILQIKAKADDDSVWESHEIIGNKKTSFSLDSLAYDTPYLLRVIAFKDDIQSPFSDTLEYFNELEKPVIRRAKHSISSGVPGSSAMLIVKIENYYDDVKWFFEDELLEESDKYSIEKTEFDTKLEITDLNENDAGRYTAEVSNVKGRDVLDIFLTVLSKPTTPKLRITDIGNTFCTVYIEKSKGESADNIIDKTIVKLYDESGELSKEVVYNKDKVKDRVIADLIPDHTYKMEVYYENSFSVSDSVFDTVTFSDSQDFSFPNCKLATSRGEKCKACANGFGIAKSTGECEVCLVANCKTCVHSKKGSFCQKCKDGYHFSDGQCIGSAFENCAEGNEDYCQYCRMGYYKNFKSECIPCELKNCEVCYGPDQPCGFCAEGYSVQEDGTCGRDSCNGTENCDKCIDDVCARCLYGFYSEDEICLACSDQIENCVNCMTREKKMCRVCRKLRSG